MSFPSLPNFGNIDNPLISSPFVENNKSGNTFSDSDLLLEDGQDFLLEDGENLLLEGAP